MFSINFQPRLYQETILHTALKHNTLTVLGTGLGKTKLAILTAVNRLNSYPKSKILFLTPTKPLAAQIAREFKESTNLENVQLFTGEIAPKKRKELIKDSKIIISTPQTISNDIINNRINLENFSLLVVDEAHRAVKDYDYVWIAKQYHKKSTFPRILGLTASPGSNLETIQSVCKNLYIEEIETRTEEDPDVKKYIQPLNINWIKVDLPEEFKEIQKFLNNCFKEKLSRLKDYGASSLRTKKDLITLQRQIQAKLVRGTRDFMLYKAVSVTAEAIKVHHALELIETQGIHALNKYIKDIFESAEKTKVKAVKNLVKDLNFKSAYIQTQKLLDMEHPKLIELKKLIKKNKNKKIIVFNQYRDSAKHIEQELNKITKAKLFVGQTKKSGTGLTQKEQINIIKDFTDKKYNVLVSTSIGEEGLDIPKVDLVIFYEPIPSAIRSIQRKGRTARLEKGALTVLMTKNTTDEAYHWIAYHKEKNMHKVLKNIKEKLKMKKQPTLKKFVKEDIKIFADSREKGSQILKELSNLGLSITTQNLTSADYIVSDAVGIEVKTKPDFINSMIDKRLLTQLKGLRNNFEKPLIIIQGEEDLYSIRRVHPNAIQGMLATIALSYQIPLIFTSSPQETASLIRNIAKREQDEKKQEFSLRLERKPLTTKEQQEFIIESLPGVGPSLAKSLLKEFKTIKKIVNSPANKLKKVEKLGDKKSTEIERISNENYPD